MEQKTPARGHSLGRKIIGAAPVPVLNTSQHKNVVQVARDIAQALASMLPEGFDKVLPRGYSLAGHALLMARFEIVETRGQALYARHPNWTEKEARVFVRDIKDGWLDEVSSFMRWQFRGAPIDNAVFQHALVHVKDDGMRRLLVTK